MSVIHDSCLTFIDFLLSEGFFVSYLPLTPLYSPLNLREDEGGLKVGYQPHESRKSQFFKWTRDTDTLTRRSASARRHGHVVYG